MCKVYKHGNKTTIIQTEWFSPLQCRENPEYLYVFGDNTMRRGKGGQAIIRDELNTFGVVTKNLPSQYPNSFFSGSLEEEIMILNDLTKLEKIYISGRTIVLPAAGLGTGLSELPTRAPELDKLIKDFIQIHLLRESE